VGVLVGLMFLLAGIQNVVLTTVAVEHRWVPALFSVLFLISALVCFASPVDTFAGLADMLGFLFLIVGVWWMVQAFLERPVNPDVVARPDLGHPHDRHRVLVGRPALRHEGLHAARLRGHLALMQGTVDIVRAFEARRVHKEL
jgi:uncharacterized membrane protein HdeD (DUF308 family)